MRKLYHNFRAIVWIIQDMLGFGFPRTVGDSSPTGIPLIIVSHDDGVTLVEVDKENFTYKHPQTPIPAEYIQEKVWEVMQDNRYKKEENVKK